MGKLPQNPGLHDYLDNDDGIAIESCENVEPRDVLSVLTTTASPSNPAGNPKLGVSRVLQEMYVSTIAALA